MNSDRDTDWEIQKGDTIRNEGKDISVEGGGQQRSHPIYAIGSSQQNTHGSEGVQKKRKR